MSIDITEGAATELSVRVAAQIRAVMGFRGIRQSVLARRIGKGEQWLSVRLRGVQPIDLNDLELIANALNVEPADLLRPGAALATLGYPAGDRFGTVGTHVRPRAGRPPSRTDARRMDDQRTRRRHRPVGR